MYGSVRGALSDERPYRDSNLPGRKTSLQENEASAFENRVVSAHTFQLMVALLAQPLGRLLKAVLSAQLSNGQRTGKDLPHLPKLKLVALCNRFGVHGLLRSLVVAFLAVAVRCNSGFRTAIIRMLVFHRGPSALPVHNGPLREAQSTPAYPSKTT